MLNFCRIVAAILKMATGRNFSMLGINLGHHYLPTYQILMISDNVEFLPLIFMTCFDCDKKRATSDLWFQKRRFL